MNRKTENINSLKRFLGKEYKKLVNYARNYFGNRFFGIGAEDIVQDVALNIFNKLDLETPFENLASYFYRSIKNKIIDLYRKPNNNVSIEDFTGEDNENLLLKSYSDDIFLEEDYFKNEKLQKKMMDGISKLKPDEQAIIFKTEFEKYTFEELSKKWNIPVGTLLSRKHRALNKLYKILKDEIEISNLK